MTAKDFKMIYEAHFDDLRRYLIYRSGDQDLSKDIAQNVFMNVWTKKIEIALIVSTEPPFGEPGWLNRIQIKI